MDKLAAMRAFVEIADRGSLTAAAVSLSKSQPTMVRTLASLEAELGVRLIRRTTRRLALTDEGRIYLDRAKRILLDVQEAEEAASNRDPEPRGDLRITAPVTFGQWHVVPAVTGLVSRFPGIRAELVLLDRVVNLLEETVDLAVRIGHLPDSTLVGRTVGRMRRVTVASPALLEAQDELKHPTELTERPCVRFRALGTDAGWRFNDGSANLVLQVDGPFTTNQAMAAVDACKAGLGYGQFLAYQVEAAVASGELRLLLEHFEQDAAPVSLVYTEARLMSRRLRVGLDFMGDSLRSSLSKMLIR